jgi:hypothetical protein
LAQDWSIQIKYLTIALHDETFADMEKEVFGSAPPHAQSQRPTRTTQHQHITTPRPAPRQEQRTIRVELRDEMF